MPPLVPLVNSPGQAGQADGDGTTLAHRAAQLGRNGCRREATRQSFWTQTGTDRVVLLLFSCRGPKDLLMIRRSFSLTG